MAEILDIVDQNDEVIGQAERAEVHKKGLICRMVYVSFYTPAGEIILQRRSKSKKSNPGRLTTTVSGHVESGMTYDQAAMRETEEETGIIIDVNKMKRMTVQYKEYTEGNYISNAMRALYVYEYDGDINQLKVEDGEGAGFEKMTVAKLRNQFDETPENFVPFLVDSVKSGWFD